MPTWALGQFGLVVREAAEGVHAFWSCHFLASHHIPWRWMAANGKGAWKRQKISANVVKPEGLTGRPIPSGGGKTNCMKWAQQRKPKGKGWSKRKKQTKHRPCRDRSWQCQTLCVCCLEVKPVALCSIHVSGRIGRRWRKIYKCHKNWVYDYSWKILAPQCRNTVFLFRLRTSVISARASMSRCKHHMYHWPSVLRSRSPIQSTNGTHGTCCKLSHKENYSIQMVLSSWYVQP